METIKIDLPRSWEELTTKQLYYVYNLLVDNLSLTQIKTYCFIRWSNLRVEARTKDGYFIKRGKDSYYVSTQLVADAIHALDWLNDFPATPVRIAVINGREALDASLFGVAFDKYIYCDNLYQGFLVSQNHGLLEQMAQLLYGGDIKLNKVEKISIFYWWASLKRLFQRSFPHFFQPAPPPQEESKEDMHRRLSDAMNAQIRALTKGDITKEKEILSMDTWRALTELDAQAREYAELKAKYGK